MKRIEITCAGCGKKVPVTTGEGHTGVVKCECGVETTVQGEPTPIMKDINRMLPHILGLVREVKDTSRRGVSSGLDDGIHIVTRDLVIELLEEEAELREALKVFVRTSLRNTIFGKEDDGGDGEQPEVPQG